MLVGRANARCTLKQPPATRPSPMDGCKCAECSRGNNEYQPTAHATAWAQPCHGYANGCVCRYCTTRAGVTLRVLTRGPQTPQEQCSGAYTCLCSLCVAERAELMRQAQRRAA